MCAAGTRPTPERVFGDVFLRQNTAFYGVLRYFGTLSRRRQSRNVVMCSIFFALGRLRARLKKAAKKARSNSVRGMIRGTAYFEQRKSTIYFWFYLIEPQYIVLLLNGEGEI